MAEKKKSEDSETELQQEQQDKKENDNDNSDSKLSIEEIKKLPPEKRIAILKRIEEQRKRDLEQAELEEKKAISEISDEKFRDEEERKKKEEFEEKIKKQSLEEEVGEEAGGRASKTGVVDYASREQQLRDFYAVTSRVKETLPGVLERIATGKANKDDERFLESYRQSMEAVRAEASYVSRDAKKDFYAMQEQLDEARAYMRHDTGTGAQKSEERKTSDNYRTDKR